jgi:hypothetical protein
VLLDVLGEENLSKYFARGPRHLWDAYGISLLTSVAALARRDVEQFKHMFSDENQYKLLPMKWSIPLLDTTITDWSYSNVSRLWHYGYQAGKAFCASHRDDLPDRVAEPELHV